MGQHPTTLLFTPKFIHGVYGSSFQKKTAHTALAVKACLLGGKTATLNAQ